MRQRPATTDQLLRTYERDCAVACASMAAAAAILGGWRASAAVLAGGGLMAFSYFSIKGAVETVARVLLPGAGGNDPGGEGSRRRRRLALAALKYLARLSLLGVAAYGILLCFQLHPAGVLAGALSPFLGALGLMVRMPRATRGAGRPL